MGNRIYVGNLSFNTTDDDLRNAFAPHGEVVSANVIVDRTSGHSRGFGFVEMATPEQAKAAIEALNGSMLDNRALTVNEAREKEPRRGPGGGFSGGSDFDPGRRRRGGGGRRGGRGGGDRSDGW